jgi:hypothetical protein
MLIFGTTVAIPGSTSPHPAIGCGFGKCVVSALQSLYADIWYTQPNFCSGGRRNRGGDVVTFHPKFFEFEHLGFFTVKHFCNLQYLVIRFATSARAEPSSRESAVSHPVDGMRQGHRGCSC